MGKAYGHQYFKAGGGSSTGEMVCAGCHKPIDNKTQDWMSYKKPKAYDWGYVCWHRECRNDPQWAKIEANAEQHAKDYAAFKADLDALRAKWPAFDIASEIEERDDVW